MNTALSLDLARRFAEEWIEAWNLHDLERILSHYADDFEMHSPFIVELMGEPSGIRKGKARVRPYGGDRPGRRHASLHESTVGP